MGWGQAQEPLAGAVGGKLLGDDLGPREGAAFGQPVEHRPGDMAHRREFAGAAMVDPAPQLRGAHIELALGRPSLGKRAPELGARDAGEVRRRTRFGLWGKGGLWTGFYHGARARTNADLSRMLRSSRAPLRRVATGATKTTGQEP